MDLTNAALAKAETDAAIAELTAAVKNGDAPRVRALKKAIEGRVDALDAFYLRHEHDHRAILFEEQRIRLRQALAATAKPPPPPPRMKTLEAPSSSRPPPPPPRTPKEEAAGAFETTAGVFRATDVPGIYRRATESSNDDDFLDVQFILTAAEYDLLLHMRRQHANSSEAAVNPSEESSTTAKEITRSPYINSSVPYVDATRIEAVIYRSPNKPRSGDQPHWNY